VPRTPARSARRWTIGLVCAAALAAPSAALGAAHTYASGTLGAGGAWSNPATAVFMNYNRMSVTTSSSGSPTSPPPGAGSSRTAPTAP